MKKKKPIAKITWQGRLTERHHMQLKSRGREMKRNAHMYWYIHKMPVDQNWIGVVR